MSRDTVTASSRGHAVLVLSRHAPAYRQLIEQAGLPDLAVLTPSDPSAIGHEAAASDIVFGEPPLVAPALPSLPGVRWVQSTWAGVEPLLAASLRRNYILTNARGVFGGLMCEYVFGYLIAHERRMFDKYRSQQAGRWDPAPPGTIRGRRVPCSSIPGEAPSSTRRRWPRRSGRDGWQRRSSTCSMRSRCRPTTSCGGRRTPLSRRTRPH